MFSGRTVERAGWALQLRRLAHWKARSATWFRGGGYEGLLGEGEGVGGVFIEVDDLVDCAFEGVVVGAHGAEVANIN